MRKNRVGGNQNKNRKITTSLEDDMQRIQEECHSFIDIMTKNSKIEYQAAFDVFIFMKLAQIQRQLKKKINP